MIFARVLVGVAAAAICIAGIGRYAVFLFGADPRRPSTKTAPAAAPTLHPDYERRQDRRAVTLGLVAVSGALLLAPGLSTDPDRRSSSHAAWSRHERMDRAGRHRLRHRSWRVARGFGSAENVERSTSSLAHRPPYLDPGPPLLCFGPFDTRVYELPGVDASDPPFGHETLALRRVV